MSICAKQDMCAEPSELEAAALEAWYVALHLMEDEDDEVASLPSSMSLVAVLNDLPEREARSVFVR